MHGDASIGPSAGQPHSASSRLVAAKVTLDADDSDSRRRLCRLMCDAPPDYLARSTCWPKGLYILRRV